MKSGAVHVVAASLLLSGASLIQAQTSLTNPSRLIRIIREDIKSGRGAAHEKVEAGYVRALSNSAYPNYTALEDLTGTNQVWFLERYESYEGFEKAIKTAEAEPLKSQLETLDAQDGELRSGERSIIGVFQPDLSYMPVPPNLPGYRYFAVSTVRIRPGHQSEFEELRKMLNAAYDKAGTKRRYVIYSVSSGMPAGTYLVFSGLESLKALDLAADRTSMQNAFGGAENVARYYKLYADTVVASESTLFAVNPRMSSPPKEYISADPDFWAPKVVVSKSKGKSMAKAGGQQ